MLLASRDEEILHTLARKVRLFTLDQLVGHWWTPSPSGTANARKRLRQMLDAGLLDRHRVNARPLPTLSEPVVTWSSGEPVPDFGAVAWQLQNRWEKPPVATTVYLATRRTANLYGGKNRGRLKHPHQATHDLGVSAVYLSLLKKRSARGRGLDRRGSDPAGAVWRQGSGCRARRQSRMPFGW